MGEISYIWLFWDYTYQFSFKYGPISNGYLEKCVLYILLVRSVLGVMDHGNYELWGYERVGGHFFDVINGNQRKTSFFDLTLRFELMLDGY